MMNFKKSVHNALWGSESWKISANPVDSSVITGGEEKWQLSFTVRVILCCVFMAVLRMIACGAPFAATGLTTPESQGVSSSAILRWVEACEMTAATNGFRQGFVHGFVIVRHGKVIAEGSWAPQDTLNEPHMLYSHSKSFTATAIGFLVDDGKLDIDERIVDLFLDRLPVQTSDNLRQLRVRDLLTMNTGVEKTDAERDDIRGDWIRAILANEFQHLPGTVFRYDSAATHLLAAIVERKSGRKLMDFLEERLFRPLDMRSPWSTVSPQGVACGGWGMNMTTRDMAKFGQFLLQKGVWEGKRLLSSEWIELATARQTWSSKIVVASQTIGSGSDWAQGYGFQFWRCRHGAFRADGASGQLTVVFPKEDAVVSIHAGLGDMQRELDLIWQYLLPAFGDKVLPKNSTASSALAAKCATLALPLDDPSSKPFLEMDKAEVERTTEGWMLVKNGRRLAVGDGKWAMTEWCFSDDLVEPLFEWCGTRKIAANGRLDEDGALRVSWQFLGGIAHGCFKVPNSKLKE